MAGMAAPDGWAATLGLTIWPMRAMSSRHCLGVSGPGAGCCCCAGWATFGTVTFALPRVTLAALDVPPTETFTLSPSDRPTCTGKVNACATTGKPLPCIWWDGLQPADARMRALSRVA